MQIFPAALLAVTSAQVFPDLGNFDLSAFGLGPGAFGAAAPAAAEAFAPGENDERYFFTATATTTVTTPVTVTVTTTFTGTTCWKCDAMTYEMCAVEGKFQQCPLGDLDCCFIEVRERKQKLQQLCTGCKAKTACEDNKMENFVGVPATYQCRPDYRYQKYGRAAGRQSVCRQCFKTCDPAMAGFGIHTCFGQIHQEGLTSANFAASSTLFKMRFSDATVAANFPWGLNSNSYDGADIDAFGIPTWAVCDTLTDAAILLSISTFATDNLDNVWMPNPADGKVASYGNNDNTRDIADEMLMWGLHGATKEWWSSDLKIIQDRLALKTQNVQTYIDTDFIDVAPATPANPAIPAGTYFGKK